MIDNCLTHKLSNSSQSPSSLDLLSDPNLENPKIFHLKQQKASQQKNWSMFVILPWKSYWNNLLIVKKSCRFNVLSITWWIHQMLLTPVMFFQTIKPQKFSLQSYNSEKSSRYFKKHLKGEKQRMFCILP